MAILDQIDRQLLQALDNNSRQSYEALSKTLGIAAETLRYRLNGLRQRGILSGLLTIIDAGRLGNSYYKVFLKFHNVDETKVQGVISYLTQQDPVNWVARTDGLYDIGFTIRIRQVRELSQFIDSIKRLFNRYIHSLTFAINIEVEFLTRDYLTSGLRKSGKRAAYTTPSETDDADETDLAILRAVATDTRLSAAAIAQTLGISADTAGLRLRSLEERGIITRYTILLDSSLLGQVNYYVLLYVQNVSDKRLQALVQFCRSCPRVTYLIKALGPWDYELNLEVENLEQYRSFIMDLTRNYADLIRDYYGMPVTKVYKFTITP